MTRMTFEYANGRDGVGPLLADVAFIPDGARKPLLVVMHGYGGTRGAVSADLDELARQGVVAIAPDIRGRGGSAGRWDSGGYDVDDIYWAAERAIEHPDLRHQIDPARRHVVGYSGGGGNAIACSCRFPDYFASATSFFGVADYAWFYHDGFRPDCNAAMIDAIGSPSDAPARFAARNMIPAAANAARVKMRFLWDAEEVMCPVLAVEAWIENYRRAGGIDAAISVTRPGDARRWLHNYRSAHPDLAHADAFFMKDVLAPTPGPEPLPPRGELIVPGYLRTRHFEVHLSPADCSGVARVRYDLTGASPVLELLGAPEGCRPLVITTPTR